MLPTPLTNLINNSFLGILALTFLAIGLLIAYFFERNRRKRAELVLYVSRKRFEAQYMGIPVPTFTWQWLGKDFKLVDYNNAAITWTHGGIKSLVGKTVIELYQKNQPNVVADLHKCFNQKMSINNSFWYTSVTTGEKRFFDVSYSYIPDDLVVVHTTDITNRKQAEDNLQQARETLEHRVLQRTLELQHTNIELTQEIQHRKQAEQDLRIERDKAQYCIDNVSAIIVGLNKRGNINLINQLACKLLERPEQELMGKNWFEIALPGEAHDETYGIFHQAMTETLNTIDYHENPIISRSGQHFLIAWKNNVLRDAQGEIIGCLSVGEDITERRKAEELLRARQAELAHFARVTSVGEMATVLAHELNQPLTAINVYADSCIQQLESGKQDNNRLHDALVQIAQQGQRAANIIRNLRQYLSKGKSERKPIDINNLILQTGEIAFLDAKNANIKIHYDFSPTLLPITVDLVQIEQVIVNLLWNSFHALSEIPKNNRSLSIQTRSLDSHKIEVSVIDNGRGISPADMEKIFDPFFSRKPEGMGLGLAISRSIIEAHNGRLTAVNNPQGGATFTFTLPAEQIDNE